MRTWRGPKVTKTIEINKNVLSSFCPHVNVLISYFIVGDRRKKKKKGNVPEMLLFRTKTGFFSFLVWTYYKRDPPKDSSVVKYSKLRNQRSRIPFSILIR